MQQTWSGAQRAWRGSRRLGVGTAAQAGDVRVGVMTCDMASGFGYVLGSSRDLQCTFVPGAGKTLCSSGRSSLRPSPCHQDR